MQLTIHVLVAWPEPHPNRRGRPRLRPDPIDIYVEHGHDDSARNACNQEATRYRVTGRRVDVVTVTVDSTAANPTDTARTLALHQLGIDEPAHRDLLRIGAGAKAELARTVRPEVAAAHLATRYDLQVPPDAPGWGLVLVRIGRRAELGDPEADVALGLVALETRRATHTHGDDELTFANRGADR